MTNNENSNKRSSRILIICAIAFVIIFAVANIDEVVEVCSSVLSVLSPIIIGFALAYILNPILRMYEFKVFKKLKKKNVIRALSILCTVLTALLILLAFLWILIPSLTTSVKDLVANYDSYVASTVSAINSVINKFAANDHFTEYVSSDELKAWVVNFFASSSEIMDTILNYITEFGMGLFVGVKNTVIGIFIAIYVLISKERLQAIARKLGAAFLPEKRLGIIGKYVNLTHQTFSSFFVGKIVDSLIIMLLTLVLLLIFGIHYALLIAVIVGVTNIIPVFGPFIGAIPSFLILFIVDPKEAFIFLILIIIIQQLDGNVIGPKILGDSTGISSLGVIIAIVIMGSYFGIIGMIIGVPLFAVGAALIIEIADVHLKKRGKTTNLEEYYLKDAMIDPSARRQPIVAKLFTKLEALLSRLLHSIIKVNAKRNTRDAEQKEAARKNKKSEEKLDSEKKTNDEEKAESDKDGQ